MAIVKYARGQVVTPHIDANGWRKVRTASQSAGRVDTNLITRAADYFDREFNPDDYLLTHCTIVASVDTYAPDDGKTGSSLVDGFRVNRKFADYRIKPACDAYINNNNDSWDRNVLLASYGSFIGAHNFVEHCQVAELSKGRIIDAVARDIGDSVYVDILVATDRKHVDLITAIENGKMATLSMGCTCDGTQCTKCGHWAADESELCPHVKYEKGQTFYDKHGQKHRVAELCGNPALGPQGGVQFIEASWVKTPAFTGAVLRNILQNPSGDVAAKAATVLDSPPPQWNQNATAKAAFVAAAVDDVFAGWDDEDEGGEGGDEAAPAAPADQYNDVEDQLEKHVLDRVKKRIKDKMKAKELAAQPSTGDATTDNESVVKEGRTAAAKVARAAVTSLLRSARSEAELIDGFARVAKAAGVNVPVPLYRAALRVGAASQYDTLDNYLNACTTVMGRKATTAEARTVIRLGQLLSVWGRDQRISLYLPPAVATTGVTQ